MITIVQVKVLLTTFLRLIFTYIYYSLIKILWLNESQTIVDETGNGNEEGPSRRTNIACISGEGCSYNTINYNEIVNNYANKNEEELVRNITLNCSNAASCFKGRTEILKKIEEHFATHNIVIIYGAPGIGKTETARQFTVMKSDDFLGNLIWIYSETKENLKKCFKDLSMTLDLKVTDVSQVYAKFGKSPCLFIFDNVENMASIKQYLPPTHLRQTVKILITSQYSQWDSSVRKVHLKPLNVENSLEILEDKLGDEYHKNPLHIWMDLVMYLEGIPLSLQIVSSILKEEFSKVRNSKFNIQQFICGLKKKIIDLEIPESEINYYDETVFSSIHFALERLKKEKNMNHFLDLLCFMAYLDADYIYYYNLLIVSSIEESEEELETALTKLKQYSLIQEERDYRDRLKIKIHRTIQLVLRKYDLNEQNGSMFKTLLKTVLSDEMIYHSCSVFRYVKEEKFKDKSLEFYYENYIENRTLADSYLFELLNFKCDVVLQELLSKFKDKYNGTDYYNKLLNEMLFNAINNRYNSIRIIDFLINYGAKLEISFHLTNGFHLASSWLSTALFDRLLESNISENIINLKDFFGRTILHRLVLNCNKNNVEKTIECMEHLILKWNADISIREGNYDNTILHTACGNEKIFLKMIKYLVEKHNLKNLLNTQNEMGNPPLHYLIQFNNSNSDLLEIVSYIIHECEADITIQNNKNWNTLFYVCRFGTSEVIDFIFKTRNCREFINSQDILGNVTFTQLIYNCLIKEEQEKIDLMKLFIENEMDFKVSNNKNKTLVEIAEKKEYKKLSVELKKHLEL